MAIASFHLLDVIKSMGIARARGIIFKLISAGHTKFERVFVYVFQDCYEKRKCLLRRSFLTFYFSLGSKKERRISKMLSRAASFGRKDKNKVREQSRGRKEEQSVGVVSRVSRKEAFLAAKNELLTKETVV